MIIELKTQLRQEEERASKFKKELHETEERERKLKEHIKEIEAIKSNPVEEAKNRIAELEGIIGTLRKKLKHTEEDKIHGLIETLKEKEEKLKILEEEFKKYKNSKNEEPLSALLLNETKKKTKNIMGFSDLVTLYYLDKFKKK
jgi:DNA repair exonuclease SbcCD ATPase subunit